MTPRFLARCLFIVPTPPPPNFILIEQSCPTELSAATEMFCAVQEGSSHLPVAIEPLECGYRD